MSADTTSPDTTSPDRCAGRLPRPAAADASSETVSPGLLDERTRPDFPDVYGGLLSTSERVEVAMTRIRLSTLDLGRADLSRVRSIRVLLAEVNVARLDEEAHGVMLRPDRRDVLSTLSSLLASGVIEVRSAPLGGWAPDFSVFRGEGREPAVLLGLHWFERPFPHRGPAFASLHRGDAAGVALRRFEELWRSAHDVGPAVLGILERADRPGAHVPQRVSGHPGGLGQG